ncbi:MAG TPA: hypothetical protein VGH52_05650 [Gaiellaceae bacterium]|jgi:hypothetical protein
MKILFVMSRLKYLPYFQSSLELIADRGHELVLLLLHASDGRREQAWADAMAARPNVTIVVEHQFKGDPTHKPARSLRRASEYLRYQAPEYEGLFEFRRGKARERSPRWTRMPLAGPVVAAFDRAMPVSPRPAAFVREVRPDVVAVCDPGRPGALLSAYVSTAREQGIPVALCVPSWDNLSTGQLTRVVPDAMLVWNDAQVKEAEEIHGIPRELVIATGATRFDEWFARTPRDAAAFKAHAGLDPQRPYVLWVGGALLPAARTEAELAYDWVEALRAAGDDIGVLLRPHPMRVDDWNAVDFSGFENVTVFPRRDNTMPVDEEQRADYFDSLYHASVVVGVNSSAMIEAAVVGRPVLALMAPEFDGSTTGMFHFAYLLEENGGPVRTATSIGEHIAKLREPRGDAQAFVQRFVRPHGLDQPATPLFVDALERVQAGPPLREPANVRVLRGMIRFALRAHSAVGTRRARLFA